jgi:hypothetical protein
LMEMGGLSEEQVDKIVQQAEVMAEAANKVADAEKAKKRLEEIESGVRDAKTGAKKPVPKGAPKAKGDDAKSKTGAKPKAEEAKPEEAKPEEAKAEEPKAEEPKAEEPKAEEAKPADAPPAE